jgi:hypothetical protein
MRPSAEIPPEIDDHRDAQWRREGTRQVETASDAERVHRSDRVRVADRLPPAGAVPLRGGVRPARRRDAALALGAV